MLCLPQLVGDEVISDGDTLTSESFQHVYEALVYRGELADASHFLISATGPIENAAIQNRDRHEA